MIIIVGGGIAGLSLAWQLAKRDIPVTLLEKRTVGSGASQAAGTYMEPRVGSGAMRKLEWASVNKWRAFAEEIEEVSEIQLDYRRDGQIRVAYADNIEAVKADYRQRIVEGWNAEWLEGRTLKALEPHLSQQVVAGAFLPDIDWCDGRKLCTALTEGIRKRGGIVREHARTTALVEDRNVVTGVRLADGEAVPGDKIVLCTGLGANDIANKPSDIPLSRPVKGVMLSLQMDPGAPLISHLIKRPDGILCPRSDGRLLVGVTHTDNDASLNATNEEIDGLMASAARTLPRVKDLPFLEAAVGIRSLVGDGLLRLGRSNDVDGLYYSLSHAGTGFMRAPGISDELAEYLISEQAECPNIGPFLNR